ncbi:MAG: DNA alkylation repair protein [Lapillicoccus sp.]
MSGPRRDLVEAVREALAAHAEPGRAVGQQRYMKSHLPYRGLTSPQLATVLRPLLADPGARLSSPAEWEATIRTLWDEAAYREEWYAAIALARHRAYRGWVDSASMPLWRHLVVTGGWWDVVDDVATHLVRDVRLGAPDVEGLRLREWAQAEELWLRRTAIICQVGLKARVDRALLVDAIEPNLDDRDFFIRKAIGWALRDHARIAPDWVRSFVDRHAGDLSGLSRREALRHLEASGG